jgi:ubiquinone/menaquinone biosynthesis C-methylase UbiE/peptidoglycan/xylan/chitin deacetylase (PgdA/CDA1 family)
MRKRGMIKRALFVACPYNLKLDRVMRLLLKRKVAILMYHGFTDERDHHGIENHQGKHLDVEIFRSQMEYLRKYHNIISLSQLVRSYRDKSDIPANTVAVTIDDGYESNYILAYPILKELNIPATVFLTTNFLDSREFLWVDRIEYAIARTRSKSLQINIEGKVYSFNLKDRDDRIRCEERIRSRLKKISPGSRGEIIKDIESKLNERLSEDNTPNIYRPLTWAQVQEMSEDGLICFGSHTHNHAALTRCDSETVRDELAVSKRIIEEKTQRVCNLFCYPNGGIGDFDDSTKRELAGSGYSCGFINVPGFNSRSSDPFTLKRFGLSEDPDMIEFIMTLSGIARFPGMIKDAALEIREKRRHVRQRSVVEKFDSGAERYSEKYKGHSAVSHSFAIRRQRVYDLLNDLKGEKVLDIGCGPGVMVDHMVDKGFEFYGVDISEEMIRQARERFGHIRSAQFSTGRIEKLEFPDSFFDAVICMGVVEYIEDDGKAVREMARVLKPGGYAIITLPNKRSPYRLWHKVVCNRRAVDLVKKLIGRRGPTLIHREYTYESYADLLASQSLKAVDSVYYNFNLFLFPFDRCFPRLTVSTAERLEYLHRGRLKWLGTGLVIKARREPE